MTNQRHEVSIKYTDCKFNEARKICYFVSLYYLLYLQDLNLILVSSHG